MRFRTFYKSIIIFIAALLVLLESCNNNRISETYDRLSEVEAMLSVGKKDDALSLLFDLENNLDQTVHDTLKYKVLSKIGSIYYADFKRDKADIYFKKALDAARKCNKECISMALWNRCLTISDSDSVLVFLKECQDISHECGSKYTEAMAGINLANAYVQLGNLDKACEILDNMDDVVGNDSVLIAELSNAKLNYLITDKCFDKAKEMLDNQNVSELNIYGKHSRYQNLYTIEIENRRYEKAIEYRDSIDEIKNKIDSISLDEKLSKVETEFSSKLEKDKRDRDITVIIGLCIIIMLVAFLFLGIKRRLMMRRQLELNEQISKLNLKISQLIETRNENSSSHVEVNADIQSEVIEKLRLNKELFVRLPIYSRLKQLNLKRDSENIYKTEAKEVLDGVIGQFADVCSNLRQLYVSMTYDDVLYCAVVYAGFSKEVASVALGASEDALRRRKSRIKQKLPQVVFGAIFGTKA